jgi:hypothetical protein
VRLRVGQKPSQLLKELTGTASAQVKTPPAALMTIDNVLKAVGRTVKGPDCRTLEILEARQTPTGDITLRVEVRNPNTPGMGGRINAFGRGRVVRVAAGGRLVESDSSGAINPALLDASGNRFPLTGMENRYVPKGNEWVQEYLLTYRVRKGQEEGAQLVFTGQRTLLIELPFTLKNVALP